MKILICGTYCAGKTTLAKALLESISNAVLIEEPAREVLDYLPNTVLGTPILRNYLFARQVIVEKMASEKYDIVICDAGIESNIAHNRLFNSDFDGIPESTLLQHERYDHVFITSCEEVEIIDDGERYIDPEMRFLLDQQIRRILKVLKYKPIELKGPLNIRLKRIKETIANKVC